MAARTLKKKGVDVRGRPRRVKHGHDGVADGSLAIMVGNSLHGRRFTHRLARRQHHHHLPVFHFRHLFDLGFDIHISPDPLQHFGTQFLMRHFAATEA